MYRGRLVVYGMFCPDCRNLVTVRNDRIAAHFRLTLSGEQLLCAASGCAAVVRIGSGSDDYRACQLAPGHVGQHVENIACDHPDGSGRRQQITIKWRLDETYLRTHVDLPSPLHILSLCSGGGGLDLGVRLAAPDARTVCYVEREAPCVGILAAHMQAGEVQPRRGGEPGQEGHLRSLADELASGLARRDRLAILGNGVVPMQAALAWYTLAERLGL